MVGDLEEAEFLSDGADGLRVDVRHLADKFKVVERAKALGGFILQHASVNDPLKVLVAGVADRFECPHEIFAIEGRPTFVMEEDRALNISKGWKFSDRK